MTIVGMIVFYAGIAVIMSCIFTWYLSRYQEDYYKEILQGDAPPILFHGALWPIVITILGAIVISKFLMGIVKKFENEKFKDW